MILFSYPSSIITTRDYCSITRWNVKANKQERQDNPGLSYGHFDDRILEPRFILSQINFSGYGSLQTETLDILINNPVILPSAFQ